MNRTKDEKDRQLIKEQAATIRLFTDLTQAGSWVINYEPDGSLASVQWRDGFRRLMGYHDQSDCPNEMDPFLRGIRKQQRGCSQYNGRLDLRQCAPVQSFKCPLQIPQPMPEIGTKGNINCMHEIFLPLLQPSISHITRFCVRIIKCKRDIQIMPNVTAFRTLQVSIKQRFIIGMRAIFSHTQRALLGRFSA